MEAGSGQRAGCGSGRAADRLRSGVPARPMLAGWTARCALGGWANTAGQVSSTLEMKGKKGFSKRS